MGRVKSVGSRLSLLVLAAAVFCMAIASSASAAMSVDAKDFTEPAETQIESNLPVIIAFVAALFTIGLVIAFIRRHARSK